jgi:transporter family-2 protein
MDFVWAVLAGSMVPIQAGINSQLRNTLGHPALAVLVSLLVSLLSVGAFILCARLPLGGFGAWQQAPWWAWLGGICGAVLLAASTTLAPRMGSLALIACIIAGQVLTSVALDQFGLLGFKQHSLNAGRLIGMGCLTAGVYLILRY